MKRIFPISILTIFLSFNVFGQDDQPTDSQQRMAKFTTAKRNELSLDVLAGIAIPAINPRYEYILGKHSGVGVDLFVAITGDDFEFDDYEKFSVTPFFRQYFFSKEDFGAKGFYAEGFIKFFTFEDFDFQNNLATEENYFETSIGAGIGWKWISESGFLVDLGIGFGRNLGLPSVEFNESVQLRGGLHFGWRF